MVPHPPKPNQFTIQSNHNHEAHHRPRNPRWCHRRYRHLTTRRTPRAKLCRSSLGLRERLLLEAMRRSRRMVLAGFRWRQRRLGDVRKRCGLQRKQSPWNWMSRRVQLLNMREECERRRLLNSAVSAHHSFGLLTFRKGI